MFNLLTQNVFFSTNTSPVQLAKSVAKVSSLTKVLSYACLELPLECIESLQFTRGEKYLCRNLGVKEGGGCLLKGGIFSGTYGIITKRI